MLQKSILLLTLLVIQLPLTNARLYSLSTRSTMRRDCILYDYPTKEFCNDKFPTRVTAKVYRERQEDLAFTYIMVMAIILITALIYQ